MRIAAPALFAVLLASCTAEPKIVAATPVSIEIDCVGLVTCKSAQSVADLAETYCQKRQLHAALAMISEAESGNERAVYSCVAAPAPAPAPRP